jgi:hypothetical protein
LFIMQTRRRTGPLAVAGVVVLFVIAAVLALLCSPDGPPEAAFVGDAASNQHDRQLAEVVRAEPQPLAAGAASAPDRLRATARIEVVTAAGEPVPGALVMVASASTDPVAVESDALGVAAVEHPGDGTATVSVSAPGFAAHRELVDPLPSHLRVVLQAERRLHGRVVRSSGVAVAEPVLVLAWPVHGSMPSPEDLRLAHAGRATFPWTRSGTDGTFELPGLDPKLDYQLAAGSTGWCTRAEWDKPVVVRGGDPSDGHELVVWPVAAALLRYVWPPDVNKPSAELISWSCKVPSKDAEPVSGIELGLCRLAEVPAVRALFCRTGRSAVWQRDEAMWDTRLVAFTAQHAHLQSDGGLTVAGSVAGRSEFTLAPFTGSLPTYVVAIERPAGEFGSLDVRLLADYEAVPRSGSSEAATVVLQPTRGGASMSLRLYDLGSGVTRFDGLPAGEYSARLVALRASLVSPAQRLPGAKVLVGSGASVVEFDVRGLQAIEIVPVGPDGRPVRDIGRIVVTPRRADGRTRSPCAIAGPPYVVQGLDASTHDLIVHRQRAAVGLPLRIERVAASGPGVTRLLMPLER